mgnify:CR=1 FL=1
MITKDTQLCMSLAKRSGNFGTLFHNFLYEKLNINYIYKAFTTENIKDAINGIRALNIRGCAISMPYKVECIQYLDELDASAQKIQSVNTIVNTGGKLKGYNTDYIAVTNILQERAIKKETSFIVKGSGGMAKAVLAALADNNFKNGIITARNICFGERLAHQYGYTFQPLDKMAHAEMLINTTSIGMTGDICSNDLSFDNREIANASIVLDVVAVPTKTLLIKEAQRQNKKIILGFDIAVKQSLEQFVLYTGVRPDVDLVHKAIEWAQIC